MGDRSHIRINSRHDTVPAASVVSNRNRQRDGARLRGIDGETGSAAGWSIEMVDAFTGDNRPRVASFFNACNRRSLEEQIGKSPNSDCRNFGQSLAIVYYGRATAGAEMEGCSDPTVSDCRPITSFPAYTHINCRKAGLRGEGAATTPLTIQAVTNRNAGRLPYTDYLQLPTAAGGTMLAHETECIQSPATQAIRRQPERMSFPD